MSRKFSPVPRQDRKGWRRSDALFFVVVVVFGFLFVCLFVCLGFFFGLFFFWFFETGFLCVALAVLELTL
jgi:hypothetical protein